MAMLVVQWVASAAISYALNSMLAKGQHIVGPKLNDLKVTTNDYGVPIPEVYGTVAVAGDYDWCTDLQPETTITESGGKGTPSNTFENTQYVINCRVSACVGPGRILRIWMNGLLVYHNTTGAQVDDPRGNPDCVVDYTIIGEIRLFEGSEDQVADALEESWLGVGNVPGYRGKVGVVVEHMVLDKLGNRPPTFLFEVAKIKSETPAGAESTLLYSNLSAAGADGVAYQNGRIFYPLGFPARVLVIDSTTGALLNTITISNVTFNPIVADPVSGYVWCWTASRLFRLLDTGTLDATITGLSQTGLVYNQNNGDLWRTISGGTMRKIDKATGANTGSAITAWYDITFDALGNTWQTDGGSKTLRKITTANVTTTYTVTTGASYLAWLTYDPDRDSVWILCGGASTHELVEFSLVTLDVVQTLALPATTVDLAFQWIRYDAANQRLWFASSVTDKVHIVDTATATMLDTVAYDAGTMAGPAAIDEDGCAYFPGFSTGFSTTTVRKFCYQAGVLDFTHYWQDVVQDVSDKVGLGDYLDLPTRTTPDIVDGYRITAQMPARSAIEPLQPVFYFDGVESGDTLKFVKRGGASALTITEDDLAAHNEGDVPPILEITRGQELETPREVSMTYIRADGEYEQGMQYARRQVTEADGVLAMEAPIVLTDEKALEACYVALYEMEMSRTRYAWSVSREYSKLEPTDPFTAIKDETEHLIRALRCSDSAGVRKFEGVKYGAWIYDRLALNAASSLIEDDYSPAPIEPTEILLLDLPMLRDEDNDAGFYAVATNDAEQFNGAVLYRSVDGGTTYQRLETFTTRGVVGTAGALGNFTGGNVFDTSNTVSVVLDRGELESTTELGALNGANVAAIGADGRWEIVIFQTATLTAPLTYTLSTLLRGRLGTEWAIPTHQAGDRFVLLTVGLMRISGNLASIGIERQYKAVSSGEVIGDITEEDFTNTGVALKPYAPTQLTIENDGSNNLTGTFVRRTRAHWDSIDAREAPLYEETEAYEIDVLAPGSPTLVVRTIETTDETFTYSSAEQTADGLTPGGPHTYSITQISASVGRGYALEVTA